VPFSLITGSLGDLGCRRIGRGGDFGPKGRRPNIWDANLRKGRRQYLMVRKSIPTIKITIIVLTIQVVRLRLCSWRSSCMRSINSWRLISRCLVDKPRVTIESRARSVPSPWWRWFVITFVSFVCDKWLVILSSSRSCVINVCTSYSRITSVCIIWNWQHFKHIEVSDT
jgi:hypothetical protein